MYVIAHKVEGTKGMGDLETNHKKQIIQMTPKVENLIDRVWTEENGRPPNIHKQVITLVIIMIIIATMTHD